MFSSERWAFSLYKNTLGFVGRYFLAYIFLTFLVLVSLIGGVSVTAEEALSDPTQPLGGVKTVAKVNTWHLQSVIIGSERKVAVINGQLLHESDTFKGLRLVSIMPNKVVVQYQGQHKTLVLQSNVKKPIKAGDNE